MKKIYLLFITFITFFLIGNVSAASLDLYASTTSTTVGNSVIVTVKGNNVIGKVSLQSSNNNVLSGGASAFWIENDSITYTFKANSAGSATITLKPIDVSDGSGNVYSTSKSITINVRNKPVIVLSKNNNLASLDITDYTLSPEFNADTLEYSVTLKPETTSISVNATASDNGASITGNGIREVTDGENRLEVVVTAENGSSKTYVINATVEEYNPVKVTIDNEEYTVVRKKTNLTAPKNYQETTVKINEEEVPAFYSEITGYTLIALKNSNGEQNFYVYDEYREYHEYGFGNVILYPLEPENLKEGYYKTTITYNDNIINAYKYKENSKYSLLYGMNVETGKINYYLYEETEDTIQIYDEEIINELTEQNDLYFFIIMIESGIVLISFISIIIYIIKKNKKEKIKFKKVD